MNFVLGAFNVNLMQVASTQQDKVCCQGPHVQLNYLMFYFLCYLLKFINQTKTYMLLSYPKLYVYARSYACLSMFMHSFLDTCMGQAARGPGRKISARPKPFCRNVKISQCTCSFTPMHKPEITPKTSYHITFFTTSRVQYSLECIMRVKWALYIPHCFETHLYPRPTFRPQLLGCSLKPPLWALSWRAKVTVHAWGL